MHDNLGIRLQVSERSTVLLDTLLSGPVALVGSSSHCDAQLGQELVAPEQLRLEISAGVLFAEVLTSSPLVTVNGIAFRGGQVLEGTDLHVGTLRLRMSLEKRLQEEAAASGSAFAKNGLLLMIFAVLATMVAGFLGLGASSGVAEVPRAPDLFTDKIDVTCPEAAGEAALIAADELLVDAQTRHERAYFETHDGVKAVHAYKQSVACLKAGGEIARSQEVQEAGARFEKQVVRDFHLHQVRLYRAMALGDEARAEAEVELLERYLGQRNDPYVAWLDQMRRNLHAKARPQDDQTAK